MRQGWIVLALGAGGCGFPSPWTEAEPSSQTIEGWMRTALDHRHPGAGWFRAGGVEAFDFGQASRQSVRGAKDDVIVLQIGKVSNDGLTVLELDVALGSWVAGPLPVDGDASIGELRTPDGNRFVVGGTLDVRSAGATPGETVEVAFTDLVLAEEQP